MGKVQGNISVKTGPPTGLVGRQGDIMGKFDLVITRHKALVTYLAEKKLIDPSCQVEAHASPDLVRGKRVIGVLPHSLSCLTESFTEIPLRLPQELRGKELILEDVRKYAGQPATYKVTKLNK